MPANIWYVAFRRPKAGAYVRNSITFPTEAEAKKFARQRLAEGCEITAGTINPHVPKATIGSWDVLGWLESE